MGFRCLTCGKNVEELEGRIRCPYCGSRIFSKTRPKNIRRIQAR